MEWRVRSESQSNLQSNCQQDGTSMRRSRWWLLKPTRVPTAMSCENAIALEVTTREFGSQIECTRDIREPCRHPRRRPSRGSFPANDILFLSLFVCAVWFCELRPRAFGREDLRQRNVGGNKVGKNRWPVSLLSLMLFSCTFSCINLRVIPAGFRSNIVGWAIKYWHRSVRSIQEDTLHTEYHVVRFY